MINVNKLKKVKSNFPVMVGKGAISKKDCEKLIHEIRNAKSFDDLIQGGRNRINKGSSNFKNYLKKSNYLTNYINNLIANLFTKKLKIDLKKLLRIMVGLMHTCLANFCGKNLQIKN